MEITLTRQNAFTLQRECEWLSTVIDTRIKLYFQNECEFGHINEVNPPTLEGDPSPYAGLLVSLKLTQAERLLLILALSPHLCPQLLDVFFTKNVNYDRGFTEFGGLKGKNHGGFLPTLETALYLLSGQDLEARFETLLLLNRSRLFSTERILLLVPPEAGEPLASGAIQVRSEFLASLHEGENQKPIYSSAFPAKQVHTEMDWNDLVLEPHIKEEIQEIRTWLLHGHTLMQDTMLRKKIKPGYRGLFYGPPGTGKTLTACLLGKSTGREVYRIDLSMIVSKYIGETEKNLAQVFDQAEHKNWILFFDEADALFGKRTATSSSNDRYANQEVAYLLQRVEDFPGTVLLASNLKSNIDEAFVRRFQSMVHFPMPGHEERLRLWQNAFHHNPSIACTIDFSAIADQYALSGGSIINVLRFCVLRSIGRTEKIILEKDVREGIKKEFAKEGKTL